MSPLAPWLRAAIVGPSVSITALVTGGVLLGFVDPHVGRFMSWAYGMAVGGALAVLCAGALLTVDVAFRRAKLRKLPTGPRAFAASAAMPFAVIGIFQALSPSDDFGPTFVLSVIAPIVTVALVLRYTFGEAPGVGEG